MSSRDVVRPPHDHTSAGTPSNNLQRSLSNSEIRSAAALNVKVFRPGQAAPMAAAMAQPRPHYTLDGGSANPRGLGGG